MYSDSLLELFESRAHAGSLPDATHRGEAGAPGQGPYVQLWLRVEDGVIRKARFKTYGCPAAIACAEAACGWSEGKALAELARVSADEIAASVAGVPEGKEHCPELAATALHSVAGRP